MTVSLDGHTPELYRAIRGVDGLGAVVEGVRKLRALAPHVGVWARSTLHRHNFRFLPDLVAKSREMGLDQISFLAADVGASSDAFNRRPGLAQATDETGSPARLLLTEDEADEFEAVVEATIERTRATSRNVGSRPIPKACAAWCATTARTWGRELPPRRLQRALGEHLHRGRRRRAPVLLSPARRQPAPACPRRPAGRRDAGVSRQPGRGDEPDLHPLRLLAERRPALEAVVSARQSRS